LDPQKVILTNKTGEIFSQYLNKNFTGTPRFMSLNSHNYIGQARRDDLESLIYTIANLFIGFLPWHHLTEKSTILDQEQNLELIK